ncbi:hypothetical protein ASD97_35140 [Streptomyces sp. Root63]|nr:hypothetical protein ASD97_35140 [Streptomyces sp. Root63]
MSPHTTAQKLAVPLSAGVPTAAPAVPRTADPVNAVSFSVATGLPSAAFLSSTNASVADCGLKTAARMPLRMSSPVTSCPSRSMGSSPARATRSQKVPSTFFGVSPRPYVFERAAAHPVHRSNAGSAPSAHHWIIPRQARCGSTALSSTNRSARAGKSWA